MNHVINQISAKEWRARTMEYCFGEVIFKLNEIIDAITELQNRIQKIEGEK